MNNRLEWEGDGRARARREDGVLYVLASENMNGAHGGKCWSVFVYERPNEAVTRIIDPKFVTKREARKLAENDAKEATL